jgi:hypothetical protein
MRLDRPEPSKEGIAKSDKPKFCFCVAAFSDRSAPVDGQTILTDFADTLWTIKESQPMLDFYLYIGTQVLCQSITIASQPMCASTDSLLYALWLWPIGRSPLG